MGLPISYFPYNDSGAVRYRTFPFVTVGLIVVNSVVHLALWRQYHDDPLGLWTQWRLYGVVPDHVLTGWGFPAFSNLSALFLHGDFFHLFFNMVTLWTFGRRVEDACGSPRYLVFYLMAGLAGGWLTVLAEALGFTANGDITGIGASGAISGVMGAYLVLFPGTRVSGFFALTWGGCIIPLPRRFRLPAMLYLFYFLISQLIFTYITVTREVNFGVGFLAHLGGFFSGLLIFLYLRKDVFYRYWSKADL